MLPAYVYNTLLFRTCTGYCVAPKMKLLTIIAFVCNSYVVLVWCIFLVHFRVYFRCGHFGLDSKECGHWLGFGFNACGVDF